MDSSVDADLYECVGDVPNVVFPCACLCDAETGRLAIYYSAADTVTAPAFARADELVAAPTLPIQGLRVV